MAHFINFESIRFTQFLNVLLANMLFCYAKLYNEFEVIVKFCGNELGSMGIFYFVWVSKH